MTQKTEMEDNTKYKDGVNQNARLIVRNISFKATEEALKKHFSEYGTVEEVKLLKRPDGKLVGCGFVHYTHVPMAQNALTATNKKPFLGRPINVSWSVSKHKYTEKIDHTSSKQKYTEKIDHTSSKQRATSISSDDDNKDEVKKEIKTTAEKEDKNKARINRAARLIVRNVSFKATEESLKEHFEPYGLIHEVKLLKKPDGKLVGCAFVHYKNVLMAKKALLNTNMKPFLGRPVSVDWAVAKDKYMQHVVTQQIELESKVKKEDSDSDDDDKSPIKINSEDVKDEIKSESESEDSDQSDKDGDDDDSDEDDGNSDDDNEKDDESGEEEIDDDLEDDDRQSETSNTHERKRIQLNDAEDGCTVFLTNLSFGVDDIMLRQFAEQTGPVRYALVCVDPLTEHSKGTGFIKFQNKEDADTFLSLPPDQLKLDSQVMSVKPALKRDSLQKNNNKQARDSRNLYLVKEGVIVAGTKAAVGVSASDMSKRLALERNKTQMLKNLNRFVSRYRLVVSNLPPKIDDSGLRRICVSASGRTATVTECRVMRDLRANVASDGRHPSKGYGFVMFTRHEDALACLRKLNNNPDIFDTNNRPIVSFSIEDRTALNARKKRLEKSIANNPLANNSNQTDEDTNNKQYRKRKQKGQKPDESKFKKGRFDKKKDLNQSHTSQFQQSASFKPGSFVRRPREDEVNEYTGLTSKQGAQHTMRTNHKLRSQAEVHRQNVKSEKKQSKHALKLKMAAKERIKQPKQKVNKKKEHDFGEKKIQKILKDTSSFSDLVTKYKTKLVNNGIEKVKAKWYDN